MMPKLIICGIMYVLEVEVAWRSFILLPALCPLLLVVLF